MLGKMLAVMAVAWGLAGGAWAKTVIVSPPDAAWQVRLAAKEVARYVYLRTGELPAMVASAPAGEAAIALAVDPSLGPETHALKTEGLLTRITGGDPLGVLYGAYRYAELLGVRFYLHGDVVPDDERAHLFPNRPGIPRQGH